MNDKIRELAVAANPSSKEIYYVEDSWPYNCAAWSGEDLAKFVELILSDLILKIKEPRTTNQFVRTTYDRALADSIKIEIINLIVKTYGIKEPHDHSATMDGTRQFPHHGRI